MDMLFGFFEPRGNWLIEVGKFGAFFVLSLLAIWIAELWLCRSWRVTRSNTELNIYFSWLLLFTVYGILVTVFAVLLATYFKRQDVESIYALPYLAMGLFAFSLSWYFNCKIAHRISLEAEE